MSSFLLFHCGTFVAGVQGIQVEEIYDLMKSLDSRPYGFIFLYRYFEERRSRRKPHQEADMFVTDENIWKNMFFAQQV